MKLCTVILSTFLLVSCASGKEKTYIASTPAGPVVRYFLGISLSDSLDFIRWKLVVRDAHYQLQCNYGIGKANTNGFINGGKTIEINGDWQKKEDHYLLTNSNQQLKLVELNADLLHILNEDNILATGNGGWSYTLNSIFPSFREFAGRTIQQNALLDSMVFVGRTPCKIPGVLPPGTDCYKIKWHITLYAGPGKNASGTYKLYGNIWLKENSRTGAWKIITRENGTVVYQLNDEQGKLFARFLKPAENILLFTDTEGKLLVGDEDFSYTLNRVK